MSVDVTSCELLSICIFDMINTARTIVGYAAVLL